MARYIQNTCGNKVKDGGFFPYVCFSLSLCPPTILFVEVNLGLILLSALQSLLHLLGHVLAGVGPVQEAAAAVLLHHLGAREARQLAEAVGAVDDGIAPVALGVTQQEIAVCEGDMKR